MKANSEHYELELVRKGRMDILKAWEAQKENGGGGNDQVKRRKVIRSHGGKKRGDQLKEGVIKKSGWK